MNFMQDNKHNLRAADVVSVDIKAPFIASITVI